MGTGEPVERRSIPEAVMLTFLVVLAAAIFVVAVAAVTFVFANDVVGTVATIAAVIAVLSFVTLRAYAPRERIPWAPLVVVSAITVVLPLVYVCWHWMRRRPTSPLAKPDVLPRL
jgi:amino acid transporter